MKKSYHSTVVPTTVANTTRRRSVGLAIVPVGVNPAGCGEDCSVLMVLLDSCVGLDVAVTIGASAGGWDPFARSLLARSLPIIYDLRYDASIPGDERGGS